MSQGPMSSSPSKGGVMRSQIPTSYQSPFGRQVPMQQPSYQTPFGNQNYRTQTSPSKGGVPSFGGPAYQQPGQFGGQVMNRPMRSPGSKGGYSDPVQIQPYPMPSPGGKGRSYQRPPTPYGYGQTMFSPGQFSGYGRPSSIFSFETPHYQPYVPQQYEQPYRGDDPRTPTLTNQEFIVDGNVTPKVSGTTGYPPGFNPGTGFFDYFRSSPSKGGTYQPQPTNQPTGQPLAVMPSMPQTKIIDPRGAFTPSTQPPAPVFPSVGGIGGGQPFVGGFIPTGPEPRFNPLAIGETPRPIFSDMSAEQKEQEEKYRAAQAKKPRYFDNVTGKTVTQSELESFTSPIQNETAAKNFWSQAQKSMDSGSLADADRFLRQYESITGTRNPMYGLSALDPSGYQSAIANR